MPFHVAAGLSLLSIVCTVVLLPNQAPVARPSGADIGPGGERLALTDWATYAQYFERPVLAGLLLQFLLFGFAFTTFTSGFALFAERTFRWREQPFTPREIGYLFAYAGFLGIILQGGLIGRLVKRFGEPTLVTAGFVSMGAGFILLGITDEVPTLIVVATLVAFGHGVLRPTLTSLISQSADPSEQGDRVGARTVADVDVAGARAAARRLADRHGPSLELGLRRRGRVGVGLAREGLGLVARDGVAVG